MSVYDYVIVGAGSAGCVLANRLSADPTVNVALLEAGGSDAHPYVAMPKAVAKLIAMPSVMWLFTADPQRETAMKPDYWLRGRVVGGSSSVNGMIWVRGQPADFDAIAARSSDDWSWQHIGRAYAEMENHELGKGPFRGGAGSLRISIATPRNALTEAILMAGERMGWPVKLDVNEPDMGEGIGYVQQTIYRGKRQSAALAFLHPVAQRPNLTVITNAIVDRVRFHDKRAAGVEVLQANQRREISARREIILAAGAVASPGILERSGIGDPARLAGLDIPLIHANEQVGENVIEHRALRMQWKLRQPLSLNFAFNGWRLIGSVLKYYLTGNGALSGAAMDMRAAFRSRPELDRPDVHAQIGLYSRELSGSGRMEPFHGFSAVVHPLRPTSTGAVHITTRDPTTLPRIEARYGSSAEDETITIAAARWMRRFAQQEPLRQLIETETAPGPAAQSDDDIVAALYKHGIPCMHAVGSCRMGKDADSVVDPNLRVRGVEGLRIMDTSIMPTIPSGNTNGPTLAMAWRAADIIRRDY